MKQQFDASLRECQGLTLELEHELKVKKLQNQEMNQKQIRIQELEKQLQYNESTLSCAVKVDLSYDVASGSEITPCNKIDKPLVVYRFTGNVTTSITTLRT